MSISRTRAAFALALAVAASSFAQSDGATHVSIQELLEAADANSSSIHRVRLSVRESQDGVESARAERRPEIRASADVSYLTNPMDPISLRSGELGTYQIPGFSIELPPEDYELFPGMEPTLIRLGVELEQPLFTWGKICTGVALAEQVVQLRGHELAQTKVEVHGEVRTRYHAIAQLTRMIGTVGEQVELAEELVRHARAAASSGIAVRTDLISAEIGLQEAQIGLRQLRYERDLQLVHLRSLTGRDELGVEQIVAEIPEQWEQQPLFPTEILTRRAREASAALDALEVAQTVAQLNAEIARLTASARPDLGLVLQLSFEGPRVPLLEPDWYGQNELGLVASLGVQTTVFDGGRSASSASVAQRGAERAILDAEIARRELERQVAETALAVEFNRARIAYLDQVASNRARERDVERAKWEAGAVDRGAVVRADLALLSVRLERQTEALELAQNIVLLESAVGSPLFAPDRRE